MCNVRSLPRRAQQIGVQIEGGAARGPTMVEMNRNIWLGPQIQTYTGFWKNIKVSGPGLSQPLRDTGREKGTQGERQL